MGTAGTRPSVGDGAPVPLLRSGGDCATFPVATTTAASASTGVPATTGTSGPRPSSVRMAFAC
eukprot:5823010-Prymnesium_polylepis.2